MNHLFDYMIVAARLAIDIPLAYFLYRMFKVRKLNGIVKITRQMVTMWVLAFTLQLNYHLVVRIMSIGDVDTATDKFDALALLVTLLLLAATVRGIYVFEKIIREHSDQSHH